MLVTVLTKAGGLLGPIASILGLIMNGIYEFFHLFGIQNIALSIIVFTFITRALMLPLTIKQQKFTKLSSKMNPELQKIQAKYKGKKDEVSLKKQQEETQGIYQKYGSSPTAGCLPLLITLPIMFALYSVINNIPAYVSLVRDLYEPIATPIFTNISEYSATLSELGKGLVRTNVTEYTSINQVIDVLAKFGTQQWIDLAAKFPSIKDIVDTSRPAIEQVHSFLGLNIANKPGWGFPGILVPILAMGLQFVQGKQMQVKTQNNNQDNPGAAAMNSMNIVMPIMSGFFCVTLPTGIGIYWIASSIFAIVQQFFVNKYMDKVDVDELIAKNVAKASKRVSRASGMASSGSTSLRDLASKQTKNIESTVVEKAKNADTSEKQIEEEVTAADTATRSSNNPKSISDIANLLKNRNDKGDK